MEMQEPFDIMNVDIEDLQIHKVLKKGLKAM
jgi:hypothetical protein